MNTNGRPRGGRLRSPAAPVSFPVTNEPALAGVWIAGRGMQGPGLRGCALVRAGVPSLPKLDVAGSSPRSATLRLPCVCRDRRHRQAWRQTVSLQTATEACLSASVHKTVVRCTPAGTNQHPAAALPPAAIGRGRGAATPRAPCSRARRRCASSGSRRRPARRRSHGSSGPRGGGGGRGAPRRAASFGTIGAPGAAV